MYEYRALVERVIDGDTMQVSIDLGFDIWHRMTIRVAHINAPEKDTPEGKAARTYADYLLPTDGKKTVVVRTYKDRAEKYGRYLADIEVRNGDDPAFDFADRMITKGHAVPYEGGKR
jgi:micrococcal nuclease